MADVAVITFPGSLNDRDAYHVFKNILGKSVTYHWYGEPLKNEYKAVILPGGFSYGDYLRAGALAKFAPAVQNVKDFVTRGGMVLGICNGFQILVESGLLPGALIKNEGIKFQCEDVHVRVESDRGPFFSSDLKGKVFRYPIAHSEGRYYADEKTIDYLKDKDLIAFRYVGPKGEETEEFNANGSVGSIAGVMSEDRNIVGLMPHPERCAEAILGNADGLPFLKHLGKSI
jgi:phosphoribosylformylglycinamidine synthase